MARKIHRRDFLRGVGGAGAAAAMGWLSPYEAGATPGVYRWATGGNPRSIDPGRAITTGDSLARNWANGLLRFKPGDGDPENFELDLAESYESRNGNREFTFKIRKGVQIHHNAGELTSEDVKWSFERMQNKKLRSIFRGRYKNIDGIETPDRYTVRFHLKEPDGLFLPKMMNFRGGYIVAKANATDAIGSNIRWNPLGTGPFQITEFKPKERIILTRHDKYFRGRPKIKRFEFHIIKSLTTRILGLRKRELDAIYLATLPRRQLEALQADPNIVVEVPDSAYNATLHFNLTMKPMDDKRVRMAIAHAINRKEIVGLFAPMAKPLYAPVQSFCVGALQPNEIPEELKYHYDPKKAKALLKAAGYGSGLRLETLITAFLPHIAKPMQVIQQQLAQVGIQLKLNVTDLPGYLRGARKDIYPLMTYGGKRFPHAHDYLFEWYHSSAVVGKPTRITNISHYGDLLGNVDKEIDEAGRITDKKRQSELLKKAQMQILRDLPAFPYYSPLVGFARRKEVDFGFKFDDATVYQYQLDERSRVS